MPSLDLEKTFKGIVCGIDEAGRGPWAGPVVAAALVLGDCDLNGINDSKKLTEKKRETIYEQLIATCRYGVGVVSAEEIDTLNILNATKLAMLRAYEALGVECDHALIDGNQLPKLPCNMQYVVKGDSVSYSIAAASIIAKVTRDRVLYQLHEREPHYNWAKNKGYGTVDHIQAIDKYGISTQHRKSYAPIRLRLESTGKTTA